ncbi:GntR family transcriptional regulator [Alicyclobacillus sacchari]|uniref:GntR family transcriptional regulator n=1 Tax=Alicyclobacillus sacchari TaxID=392010 RepID=A0A4R8LTA9_9BACL|nr:GntR family transcriptional regulator [Alicyclobacillus sacchari]TDY50015.1 GntR family transcriptional regulator [Alicyclobacillus sacchari]GMA57665.1 GntR family transcriptional regulator [Alicyclobacillus sacchari]
MDERRVGSLSFRIDYSQPIYEQIVQQFQSSVVKGEIERGSKIPSVRELAQALHVTPNTVMHAYQEMERSGLTETRRGQGTFITSSQEQIEQLRTKLADVAIQQFMQRMSDLGYSKRDILRLIEANERDEER